ncbi:hypothetical protein GOODEAATRI_012807, partial [Goodea atripinnis]
SLQDEHLKSLGRDHSSLEALQTLEEARRLCPGGVSVDIMFGRPKQTIESWINELSEMLRVCDDHVSLYQLTLERGTQLTCLCIAQNSQSRHNLSYWKGKQYIGVGPGNFYKIRTTGGCWLYFETIFDLCFGTGAHGRFVPLGEGGAAREARTQTLEPDVWIREVQQRGHGTRRRIQLGHLELLEEVLVMGMRMTKGINHKVKRTQ